MYYVTIVLILLFGGIIIKNYLFPQNLKEGLENKANTGQVNNLKESINNVKNKINNIKSKNKDYNSQLDELEKQADCKNQKNTNHSNAMKSKQQSIKNQRKGAQNFSLGGF
jgi:peptidoglycan hydrolase CwlO-like protein